MTHVIILDSTSQLDAAVDATHSTLTQPGPPVYQPSEDDLQLVEEALEKEYSKKNRLVANLDNDDLDALLRSLDRQVQWVRARPPPYTDWPGDFDLNPSPDEDFDLDKLRAVFERFYAGIITGLIRFGYEIQRIRSWRQARRTTIFCFLYLVTWYNGIILTSCLLFASLLIFFPSIRTYCFDLPKRPVTIHLPVDASDKPGIAGLSLPATVDLDDPDQQSGAAAAEGPGEQFANKASELLISLTTPMGGSTSNKAMQPVTDGLRGKVMADIKKREEAGEKDPSQTNVKDEAIQLYAGPAMRIIGSIADKWERIANALDATPPFQSQPWRVCATFIAPLLPVTTFVSAHIFMRVCGVIIGFLLFGQPIIDMTIRILDNNFPHWKQQLVLVNNLLEDIPNNNQVVLRILRNAEHGRVPLPHPATPAPEVADDDDEVDADQGRVKRMEAKVAQKMSGAKQGLRARLRNLWDKAGANKEETVALLAGHKKKKSPSGDAKLKMSDVDDRPDDNSRFYVRHNSHGPGHILIHPPSTAGPARLTFTTLRQNKSLNETSRFQWAASTHNLEISVDEVVGLKKIGSGLPARVLGHVVLGADGAGSTGLEITLARRDLPGSGEEVVKLRSIVRRDELFDRLLAIGNQKWDLL